MDIKNRKTVIAGNWKMNKTPSQAKELIAELAPMVSKASFCDIVVCVPYVDLPAVLEACRGTNIGVGAQNMHFEKSGAYTGEISAEMLTEMGVKYVIIGHSERRQYFAETDETVNKKVKVALLNSLIPIVCVGETLTQREQGITNELVGMQTKIAFMGVSASDAKKCIVAYEPVWAIGTGKTATSDQANEINAAIRDTLKALYGEDAKHITIQYGGSMNAKNAVELLSKTDVDGGLIGGASLKAADFVEIINATNQ